MLPRYLALLLLLFGVATEAATPYQDARHLGVASCAGSTCHGATRPFADSRIHQDEYFVWQRKDAHARAYDNLRSVRAQTIAQRLGIADAAAATQCLACHVDNVPAAQRGERFQLSDGVGCEACHGGAEPWIGAHAAGYKSNAERDAAGLRATWDPLARAAICSGCHLGSDAQPMSHAIMAAGHPPLLFELDTFQVLEPPHWHEDAAYAQRKGAQDPARNWAAGQAEGARQLLENLAGPRLGRGMFPELAFFDCNACHHSLVTAGRARPQRSGGLAVGAVPLADTQLVMLIRWLETGDAGIARKWHDQWVALQGAGQRGPGEVRNQAKAMLATLDSSIVPQVRGRTLDDGQLRKLLKSIVGDARGAHAGDFSDAEQTAMAVSVLTTALSQRGSETVSPGLRQAVDALYAQVRDRDAFVPENYGKSIEKVATELGLPGAS